MTSPTVIDRAADFRTDVLRRIEAAETAPALNEAAALVLDKRFLALPEEQRREIEDAYDRAVGRVTGGGHG